MAIIVNKKEKRSAIANACRGILLDYGIKNLTIMQIAKTAGVGKGTIYEYFENKEDIVFEIITMFIVEYENRLYEVTRQNITTKEKVFHFFYTLYKDEDSKKQLNIYREFLAIAMTSRAQKMLDFNIAHRKKFIGILSEILNQGVIKGEIHMEAENMVSGLLTFGLGLAVDTRTASLDAKDEITGFLDPLFLLIEKKGKV